MWDIERKVYLLCRYIKLFPDFSCWVIFLILSNNCFVQQAPIWIWHNSTNISNNETGIFSLGPKLIMLWLSRLHTFNIWQNITIELNIFNFTIFFHLQTLFLMCNLSALNTGPEEAKVLNRSEPTREECSGLYTSQRAARR